MISKRLLWTLCYATLYAPPVVCAIILVAPGSVTGDDGPAIFAGSLVVVLLFSLLSVLFVGATIYQTDRMAAPVHWLAWRAERSVWSTIITLSFGVAAGLCLLIMWYGVTDPLATRWFEWLPIFYFSAPFFWFLAMRAVTVELSGLPAGERDRTRWVLMLLRQPLIYLALGLTLLFCILFLGQAFETANR